jgi:DNA-binding transcriptional regulator YiaG
VRYSVSKTTTTVYLVDMGKPRKFSPSELRAIRKALGLTLAGIGERLAVSPRTWESWEYGLRIPSGPVSILIGHLEKEASEVATKS